MGDDLTNVVRDALVGAPPEHEDLIRARDEVVNKWCEENGVAKEDITIEQLMEIRSLPEWINPK